MPEETDDSVTTQWEGYSDYQTISQRITASIHDAIEAYAAIERAHMEGARPDPQTAARAGSRIMTAAMIVQTELDTFSDENDEYEELLDKFQGDDGYTARLKQVQLRSECPDWLHEFVADIRRAGFELGYLQAGRRNKQREKTGPTDEAREMFANL